MEQAVQVPDEEAPGVIEYVPARHPWHTADETALTAVE
jgi:hypothetical protein